MTTSSRRNFTKAAMWSVPAVSVATAVPATAASCDPAANVVTHVVNLAMSSSGSLEAAPSTFSVTYVNAGPNMLVAGSILTFLVRHDYDSSQATAPTASPVALPSSATVSVQGRPSSEVASSYELTFTVTLGADLEVNQSVAINLNATGFANPNASGGTSNGSGQDGYDGGEEGYPYVADETAGSQSRVVGCETIETTISVSVEG